MQQLRRAVLAHIRMPLQQTTSSNPAAAAASSFWRGFAGGGYLDKDEVTQRVLHVTKHFEKIDPAKARGRGGPGDADLARAGGRSAAPPRRCRRAAGALRAPVPACQATFAARRHWLPPARAAGRTGQLGRRNVAAHTLANAWAVPQRPRRRPRGSRPPGHAPSNAPPPPSPRRRRPPPGRPHGHL